MLVDILGTSWDQCLSMVQCCFTSTETIRLGRTGSPGRPPRLSHSSWTLKERCLPAYGFHTVSCDMYKSWALAVIGIHRIQIFIINTGSTNPTIQFDRETLTRPTVISYWLWTLMLQIPSILFNIDPCTSKEMETVTTDYVYSLSLKRTSACLYLSRITLLHTDTWFKERYELHSTL